MTLSRTHRLLLISQLKEIPINRHVFLFLCHLTGNNTWNCKNDWNQTILQNILQVSIYQHIHRISGKKFNILSILRTYSVAFINQNKTSATAEKLENNFILNFVIGDDQTDDTIENCVSKFFTWNSC